jgi:predicted 2-oxoglutarate/Fe(II)-dependent dioxygenase YbiX
MTLNNENSQYNIRVAEAFVPRIICEEVVKSIDPTALSEAMVDHDDGPSAPNVLNKEVRNVLVHTIGSVSSLVNGVLQRIVDELIEPFYEMQIDYWEHPDILVYPTGGFYVTHNDAESVVHDSERYVWEWRRILDRDISVVWYLNDDFDGGELFFPPFQLLIRPVTGMVVTFPSTHEYAHTAKLVTRGTRFVVATWMAAVGTARVQSASSDRVRNGSYRQWSQLGRPS